MKLKLIVAALMVVSTMAHASITSEQQAIQRLIQKANQAESAKNPPQFKQIDEGRQLSDGSLAAFIQDVNPNSPTNGFTMGIVYNPRTNSTVLIDDTKYSKCPDGTVTLTINGVRVNMVQTFDNVDGIGAVCNLYPYSAAGDDALNNAFKSGSVTIDDITYNTSSLVALANQSPAL